MKLTGITLKYLVGGFLAWPFVALLCGLVTAGLFDSAAIGIWGSCVLVPLAVALLIWSQYTAGESVSEAIQRQNFVREERIRERTTQSPR